MRRGTGRSAASIVVSSIGSIVLPLLSACATAGPSEALPPGALNRSALRASQPHSIVATRSDSPSFDAQTAPAGMLALGFVGLAVGSALENGDAAQASQTGVADPGIAIRAAIVERLARRFSLRVIRNDDPPEEALGVPVQPEAADLTLRIETSVWGILPTRAGHYGVKYRGSLRLTDNRTHQTLTDGVCTSLPVDGDERPTYQQLLADNAALLKSELEAAAEFCIDDYRKRLLGLY